MIAPNTNGFCWINVQKLWVRGIHPDLAFFPRWVLRGGWLTLGFFLVFLPVKQCVPVDPLPVGGQQANAVLKGSGRAAFAVRCPQGAFPADGENSDRFP